MPQCVVYLPKGLLKVLALALQGLLMVAWEQSVLDHHLTSLLNISQGPAAGVTGVRWWFSVV